MTPPLLLLASLLATAAPPPVQAIPPASTPWIQGAVRHLEGEILPYAGPVPEVNRALLVRSIDRRRGIAWETAPVPEDFAGEWATFGWMFGLDVNSEQRRFELLIDGEPRLEFRNPAAGDLVPWHGPIRGGGDLSLRKTKIDRHGDVMGFALLRLPRGTWTAGEPLRLAVRGESAESPAWYMTFLASIEETARLTPAPAIRRTPQGNRQPLRLDITHLGERSSARIDGSWGESISETLEFGANVIELGLPVANEALPWVEETREVEVRVTIDGRERHLLRSRVVPPRPWTIHLVQHVHTDIGYTRPQTEILPEHLRFIDTALAYCDRTDGWPDDARFRWTCETAWAVREWLARRPAEEIARLRRRVEEGRIEVTGMLLNMSEVIDEASYVAFLAPVRTFRDAGIPVTGAMQNDVNGVAWCLADHFPSIGIRFLIMGQHAHRARLPFDKATCFWWESPAGRRVLAFRADHYNLGNFWGLHTGDMASVEKGLFDYLTAMEEQGFPFDRVAVQYSGYLTDNSPPSTAACELIGRWNERYVTPHLRSSIAGEFPRWVEEQHGEELEVHRAAWPDWWTDGFGTAARESAVARETGSLLVAGESLAAMQLLAGLEISPLLREEATEIRDALLFYGEHTFGAAESIRDPLAENSVVQWGQKSSYAWEAARRGALFRETVLGGLPALLKESDAAQLVVANPLAFPRSGLIEIFADHEILPVDCHFRIEDERGRSLPVLHRSSRPDGSRWVIEVGEVPAFGYRTWRVVVVPDAAPTGAEPRSAGRVMENEYYRVELDPDRGTVVRLFDKQLELELVDSGSPWQLGQIVHETLGNRRQLEAFTLEEYERGSAGEVVIEGRADTPLWKSIAVRGELPGCASPAGLRWEIRLFHHQKRIEFHFTARKRREFDPESIFVAFPFLLPGARVVYETLGGTAAVGEDLLPGTATDWQAMQSFVAVQSDLGQIVLESDEISLVHLGGINTGEFRRIAEVEKPHVFSWVMNNYWTTNFRASQEGDFRWSYALTSTSDPSPTFAARFGWSQRIPLLGRVLPAGSGAGTPTARSLLAIEAPNVMLIAARPTTDGHGILLHLRELEGRETAIPIGGWRFAGAPARVREVTLLEEEIGEVREALILPPFATRFLRVSGR
jgi:alpha-mannosidase